MSIYTESRSGATERSTQNSSKCSDAFAKAALGEVFRACDLRLAREPKFVDRRPHERPRRLGEIANKIVDETGENALRRQLDEAAQAETPEERRTALAIAQKIATRMGVPLADFMFGRAA